ncbi:uncharacterized protein PODANS_5_12250 [Podospora anserina S mat+]|uniref:Podospora anserina S mat+ genomic DNA chromosome 5, supercontig 7 n=1 Tax=Podospora anserina (strain S / ATCC MYA-4624 / DSM 980 / FGSC 10383) TaxID=515849 RepID=B2AFQ2_PODAN|nr:uncharacterized protein PODANS_5_12250 [Podospora anserina S mat+]CAP62273.1 unnamed protein product [Podospora anserina S mat+]
MSGEAWLYLFAVIINAVNLFLQVFFTIMYSDLECDYINPTDLCNRLNTYILPEFAVHAFMTFLFLINGYWVPLILNLPLLAWNIKKILDNTHLLDATEIFRKRSVHKKESFTKLGFPSHPVLLLPLQHDCCAYPGRGPLSSSAMIFASDRLTVHASDDGTWRMTTANSRQRKDSNYDAPSCQGGRRVPNFMR